MSVRSRGGIDRKPYIDTEPADVVRLLVENRPEVKSGAADVDDLLEEIEARAQGLSPEELEVSFRETEPKDVTSPPANSDQLVLDPSDPMPTAREFVQRYYTFGDYRGLHHQSRQFFEYKRCANAYASIDEASIRSKLYSFLEPAGRQSEVNPGTMTSFKPTKSKVDNALDALRAVCNLKSDEQPPCWLTYSDIDPLDIMACANGLLHLPSRKLLKPTPQFFTPNSIEFPFDAHASEPKEWLLFLSKLWPNDPQSVSMLQEWMGHLLTPRTHFQKMLLLVGPKRSGKGTIGRVIRKLNGDRNVCGPTLANMAEQFGLSILIGKSVAIVADARISGKTDTAIITERLLSISGEDTITIPRKFLEDWNGKLPTRFMLMTNELPRIEDASGALSSRFIVLTLSESFYGREDHTLLERFTRELPGILLWALDGLSRLTRRGRFLQPESSSELIQQFEDLGSPIGAFIRERCDVGKANSIPVDRLFHSWKAWCEDNGREHSGTAQAFGRNLRAAIPWLAITQPRVAGDRIRHYEGIRLKEGC